MYKIITLFVLPYLFYLSENTDDKIVNKTIKPAVRMRILSESDGTSVEEVNLDDKITMALTLDAPYLSKYLRCFKGNRNWFT